MTLYANLGDDAIAYGINQTEVSHVITSHDLLPKFKSVLSRTPSVKFLIYFNDQVSHALFKYHTRRLVNRRFKKF